MPIKTLQQILTSMNSYISAKYPTLDTNEGTIIADVVMGAPAQEVALLYQQDQRTSANQALTTATDDGLAIHGSNLSSPRLPAVASQGVQTFFSYTQPTFDITIPAGTIVATSPGPGVSQVQFRTLTDVIMFAVMGGSYLNSSTGLYEIQANIQCTTPGVIGVVGAQTISALLTPLSGISGCYNQVATSGGTDVEDREIYRQRLSLRWQGNALGTDDGILSLVKAQTGVEDAVLVAHGLSSRNEFGAIDVYIKGTVVTIYQDNFAIDIAKPQSTFKNENCFF